MPKIVSLNSNNQVKYPATITDAVIDLNSGKPLSELLNGVDYSKQYLTFTILQEGTVVFLGNSSGVACCSLDGGRTWSEYGGTVTVQAEVGDVILWKAIPLYFEYSGIGSFSTSTASFNLSGNITSLVYGDNFITSGDTLPQSTGYACAYLFKNTNVISAKNLVLPSTTINGCCYYLLFLDCSSLVEAPEVLPATTLTSACYLLMFKNCVSLEKAPKILATTLQYACCEEMFYNCSKLNFIEAHFLTTPSTSYSNNWVAGVAPTGTFVKDSAATWNVVGNYAIPTGWVNLNENQNLTVSKDDIILSRTYNNILRANNSYSSPYATSYLYFGQVKPIDITRGSMVRYRVLAFVPGNTNYYLDSIVEWYFTTNGIYSSYYIWNNLKSTSYYPFGYHTLYRSNSTAISLSDGSYIGCYYGTSTSYGLSPNTIARTILVDILRCENCEVSLLDNIRWLTDTANLPANFKLTSTSVAYNTTNFTAVNVSTGVGLQETGDANSNTLGYLIRTNSYSKPMKAALGYGYRLLFTSADLLGWVPANTSTSSNATAARTPCAEPIDPFGEIVYYAGSGAVAVNSRPSATTLWLQYTISLGYSFNTTGAALTLTSWKPIYIKCTPLLDGSAILQGYTLDLPTEEDGFIYIYLGVAYNATAFELVINHPVYYFKNGAIRLWTGKLELESHDYSQDYFTIEALEDGDVKFVFGSDVTTDDMTSMSYSLNNGATWTLIENLNNKAEDLVTTISVNSGDCILWKGVGNTMYHLVNGSMSTPPRRLMSHFESTNEVNVKGNIMSLVFGDNYKNQLSLQDRPYCFCFLFNDSASSFLKIISAENLSIPATTLSNGCYRDMFSRCASLTTAPSLLPAATLADLCYNNMFINCTSLITPPTLPATILANSCYYYMFGGCTSLTQAPQLPATTLANHCYDSMFSGCTSLKIAPELLATTLVEYCYSYMFINCTSLVTAPQLPATTLANYCYSYMFQNCTSLTKAPELPAVTLAGNCYVNMFYGCTSLKEAPELPATTLVSYCYLNMFRGCTSLTTAPSLLPATTLTKYCYNYMFSGCTSLTTAPTLPATTLVSSCYSYMFLGCSKLSYIKALFTTTPSSTYTYNWVNGVAATGTFIKNNNATWNVTGVNGIPTGWNVYTESEYEVVRHYELVTQSANGLMSSSDKTKLDGIQLGALVNVVNSVEDNSNSSDLSQYYARKEDNGITLTLSSNGTLGIATLNGLIGPSSWGYADLNYFVTGNTVYNAIEPLATKASPALTGTPTAPTAAAGTNTTQIATTAFVKNAVDSKTHYVANLQAGTAANYITEPEFKSVKINGSTTNSASSSNCVLQYDTTNKCLKFIFN